MLRDYTKIKAWKLADDLTVAVYAASKGFPREEIYGLTSQLRRACYSVPSNIVEGSSRSSKRDYLHFLYIARGSLNEAHYFLHLSERLEFIKAPDAQRLRSSAREALACLQGLIEAVEKEAGLFGTVGATLTSLLVLFTHRIVSPTVS